MDVRAITRSDCEDFILNIHYAKRWPSISYAFGLFDKEELLGVATYGTPLSSTLRTGVAGPEMAHCILELNRLCLRKNVRNHASMLVGRSLKMLPQGRIVVSFADIEQGHFGYIYQATNFGSYGLSAKRKDWKIKGQEHLHSQTISDQFKGSESRIAAIKAKYGDDFYYKQRPRKHRYIYLVGNKTFKKNTRPLIRYEKEPYPKPEGWELL